MGGSDRNLFLALVILVAIAASMVASYFGSINALSETTYRKLLIRSLVNEIKDTVAKIRGLEFPNNTTIMIINISWVLKHWGPPPKPSKQDLIRERVYKMSFLVSPNFSLLTGQKQWTVSFMAATAGYTLYIVEENFNPYDPVAKRAIAHELTHILQYKYFHPQYPATTDGGLAMRALVEGDADFVADMYCNLTGIKPRGSLPIPVDHPYIALQSFPYIYGEKFVSYLYHKANNTWILVNQAYKNPPRSTEQVMHPEKYLAHENPVNVTLKVNEMGKPVYTDVMGEYYILLVLAPKIGLDQAKKAAEGWGGDLLALFHNNKTNTWTLYWNTTWDTIEDAKEYYNAIIQALIKTGGSIITQQQDKTTIKIYNYTTTITLYKNNVLLETHTTKQ